MMEILGKKTLVKFQQKHTDAKKPINEWIRKIEEAKWNNFSDLKKEFPSASILSDKKVIFNIKGNRYRLFTVIIIIDNRLYVKWIGTHAKYDKKTF